MMAWLLLKRDLMLAFRRGGGVYTTLSFCILTFAAFAFSLGPEALHAHAGRVLIVAVLLSCLLALPGLFERDYADGTLEQYLLQGCALEWLVLAKLTAFWLTAALPLALFAPVLGLAAGLQTEALIGLWWNVLLATPTLVSIGALGAALTLGIRRGGLAQALILLPLYIPIIIFAAAGSESAFLILLAMALVAVPVSCLLSAGLLRLLYD